jgi:ribosomal protein S27AE
MEQLILNLKIKSELLSLKEKSCPNCGHASLNRIKRKNYQKLIALTLSKNIKRYCCERCEWKGIKIG